jgi:hypothetical protein
MRRLVVVAMLAILSFAGCNGGDENTGGTPLPPVVVPPVGTLQTYLVSADSGENDLDVFRVNGDGSLTFLNEVRTAAGQLSLELNAFQPFLYSVCF